MKALIIAAAVIAIGAAALVSSADAKSHKSRQGVSSGKIVSQTRGVVSRPGGHRMGYENDPLLYRNGPYGNYPHYDPRNFWERVQSGPTTEAVSPSAF